MIVAIFVNERKTKKLKTSQFLKRMGKTKKKSFFIYEL